MSRKGANDDVSALLYIAPFIISAVYGVYLWVQNGFSALLPTSVFLTVTRDPYVFIAGSLAVLLGMIIEVNSADPEHRQARLKSAANTIQLVGVASLILAALGAWYANGFVHVSHAANDMIVGRYSIVFPTLLIIMGYLLTIQVKMESVNNAKFMGFVALLLVPAVVYEVGRHYPALGLGIALPLALFGIYLLLRHGSSKTD